MPSGFSKRVPWLSLANPRKVNEHTMILMNFLAPLMIHPHIFHIPFLSHFVKTHALDGPGFTKLTFIYGILTAKPSQLPGIDTTMNVIERGLTLFPAWKSNYIHYKMWVVILFIHHQTSAIQPAGSVIAPHTLTGTWSLFCAWIKVKTVLVKGAQEFKVNIQSAWISIHLTYLRLDSFFDVDMNTQSDLSKSAQNTFKSQ